MGHTLFVGMYMVKRLCIVLACDLPSIDVPAMLSQEPLWLLLQAALELGQALLDATSTASVANSARIQQIRAAMDDVWTQLDHLGGAADAAAGATSAQQSSPLRPDRTVNQTQLSAGAVTSGGVPAVAGEDRAGISEPRCSAPAAEPLTVADVGWAERRAAAAAQQRDSLLLRQQMQAQGSATGTQSHQRAEAQRRPLSNGQSNGLDGHISAALSEQAPVQTGSNAASRPVSAVAYGRASRGQVKYTALEMRLLRVVSAERCREFDASCLGDDGLRKPPDMVPAMPSPAEEPPAEH